MSVRLFSRTDDFQPLADAYETLKPLLGSQWSGTNEQFYKALRRLYFANVATYLCTYHDDTPLSEDELTAIEPFQELKGQPKANATPLACAYEFMRVWGQLKYNLITTDGEEYVATHSHQFMNRLERCICFVVLKPFARKE